MGEENKVILHGMWASTYSKRVELALKIKGIPYEYVEEDLSNKSPLLLKYNPVHKKIPVLVHNGKPIAESLVILEYIDETWKNEPRLLSNEPYERAKVRFWASFLQQLLESLGKTFNCHGEELEKAMEEVMEKLKLLEEGMKEFFSNGSPSINHGNVGLLGVLMVTILGPYRAQEEVLGLTILDPERNPLVLSLVTALNELPVVKEVTPAHEKLVPLLQFIRENNIKLVAN
ncbi:Glutathione S-transferase [Actinidia chinensis var. chinensis]|uniref:Glutathione S-transferase n=1 Tax=Actinidia chinensis var. chinensis TaxID=1590841 RepID=A0A2R6QH05_ACTCC|nr:Glutathione S-transferase [Actinidia chinensis var. chinensis]